MWATVASDSVQIATRLPMRAAAHAASTPGMSRPDDDDVEVHGPRRGVHLAARGSRLAASFVTPEGSICTAKFSVNYKAR